MNLPCFTFAEHLESVVLCLSPDSRTFQPLFPHMLSFVLLGPLLLACQCQTALCAHWSFPVVIVVQIGSFLLISFKLTLCHLRSDIKSIHGVFRF